MLRITQTCVKSSLYSWGILIYLDNLVNLVVFSEECKHGAWFTDRGRGPLRSHIFNTELEDDIIFCHITFTLVHTHFKKLQLQKHFCRFYVTAMEIHAGILLKIKRNTIPPAATLLLKWHLVWKEHCSRNQNNRDRVPPSLKFQGV